MGLMTTSSTANETKPAEAKRRRLEEKVDRIGRQLDQLHEQVLRRQIRLEVLEELERRGRFGLFRRL